MTFLLELALRSGVVVLVGLAAHALLRRHSAALRHAVLVVTIVASALVAPLTVLGPNWQTPWTTPWASAAPEPARSTLRTTASQPAGVTGDAPQAAAAAGTSVPSAQAPSSTSVAWLEPLALVLWVAGLAAGLGLLAVGIGRLVWIERRAARLDAGPIVHALRDLAPHYGVRQPVALVQTGLPGVLATWGLRRPRILLPSHASDWSADRIRVVLAHELSHIRRRDWAAHLAADVVRSVFWFNPLLWIACARLRRESEQACDDCVLEAGIEADHYAAHLLAIARRTRRAHTLASALPMARPSTLERRIAAMLNPALNRDALTTRALVVTALLMAAVSLPIAAVRGAQSTPLPLTGVVYDPTGAVLPQVELALKSEQGDPVQSGSSDSKGSFVLAGVAPGKYVLHASLPGFRTLKQPIDLKGARDWQRAITLQVGDLQETINVRDKRPSPSRPSAGTNVASAPLRVGGNIRPPTKITDVRPVYPLTMREAGLEGQVPLEAIIGKDGSVQSLRVLSAQVHPDFAAAAAVAVQQWRFTPTLLNGAPVEVVMNVSVSFSLEQ